MIFVPTKDIRILCRYFNKKFSNEIVSLILKEVVFRRNTNLHCENHQERHLIKNLTFIGHHLRVSGVIQSPAFQIKGK